MNFFNTKYILGNKRHGWIDYDRGISIILVAYRHCYESMVKAGLNMKDHPWLEYINVFFFGFRMPLFFIASGMFLSGSMKKYGWGKYAKNRVYSILYPMLVWGIIQITLQIIFSEYTNSKGDVNFRSYGYLIYFPRATGQFWYLNALFFVGIIYASLRHFLNFKVMHQLALGLVLYFVCSYVNTHDIQVGFLNDIMKYYLFFSIGDWISDFLLSEKAEQIFTSGKFITFIIVAFIINQLIFTKLNMMHNTTYYVENSVPLFFLLVAIVGCTLSICVSFSLKRNQKLKFLRVVGFNSVHIYCIHILVISVSRQFYMKFLHIHNPSLLIVLVLITCLLVPVMTYNIFLRWNMWWFFTLKKPEDEIAFIRSGN